MVDGLGYPLKFTLTPGQAADVKQADMLFEGVQASNGLLDRVYDADAVIDKLKQFRRVFSRFDKYAHNFMNFIHFAATLIWLR